MSDTSQDSLFKEVERQELEAQTFGFYWESLHQLIEQIQSECIEIQEAWHKNNVKELQEEIGDLIQASISLAVYCHLDPHETLLKSIEKFQRRYDAMVKIAQSDGHQTLHGQPFETLMHYWNQSKLQTKD